MKPSRGYYCIIQYCPDLGRLEAANIGVLLFCPDRGFLQARTSSDNARIRHFFGDHGHDWHRINSFKTGIEDRLVVEKDEIQTLVALEGFIAQACELDPNHTAPADEGPRSGERSGPIIPGAGRRPAPSESWSKP